MAADRRVDAGAGAVLVMQDLVQPLAHAVQALELEGLGLDAELVGDLQHRGDGVGVVGRELRIEALGPVAAAAAHWR